MKNVFSFTSIFWDGLMLFPGSASYFKPIEMLKFDFSLWGFKIWIEIEGYKYITSAVSFWCSFPFLHCYSSLETAGLLLNSKTFEITVEMLWCLCRNGTASFGTEFRTKRVHLSIKMTAKSLIHRSWSLDHTTLAFWPSLFYPSLSFFSCSILFHTGVVLRLAVLVCAESLLSLGIQLWTWRKLLSEL